MKFSLAEKIALSLGVATLVAIIVTLTLVQRMDDVMERRPEFHGQTLKSHGVETERYLDEPIERVVARHKEAIRKLREETDG